MAQEKESALGDIPSSLQWRASVRVFGNTVIVKQLGIAIGIPFGLVALVIALTSGKSVYTFYALGLIGAVLLLTWLFVMVVYRGRYEAEFVLNDKGALCRTQAGQAKTNRIVNGLAIFLGLLSGKPSVAGAGLLAQSRQEVFIRWSRVQAVKYKPRQRTILLRSGIAERVALFCTRENYPMAEKLVMKKTQRPDMGKKK